MKHRCLKLFSDGMLLATFLTTVFYSATYPRIYREVMRSLSADWIAAQQIVNCLSIIFFSQVWNRLSKKIFKFYPALCVIECLCTLSVSVWVTLGGSILSYYVLDTLVFALVSRNIICGGVRLRSLRYSSQSLREHFDNNQNAVASAATIIGSLVAIILDLNFVPMIWLASFGNCIDNAFYICIYHTTTKGGLKNEKLEQHEADSSR